MRASKTVNKIMEVAHDLHSQGIKPTQLAVAKQIGLTRQAVNHALIHYRKLDEFNNLKYSNENIIVNFLEKIDTKNMTMKEIWGLPIKGLHDMTYTCFCILLNKNNIPHRKDALERMKEEDLSKFTAKQIAEKLGLSEDYVRSIAREHNIPYKQQRLSYGVFDKLKTIDTSPYTMQELHEIIGKATSIGSLRNYVHYNKLPYKKVFVK
ncbi:hypothetical protein [Ralstonia mannitolilytica]|uniref:hypothetical protein n=1 Tax=Ralstonia mannitolilytica TaxID=105219 RepID=UPI001C94C664|nr:hypothetical protein [Ralstonia mannitolilytica]MBY4717567.1 hypothetical protein [Ralstonia mannitolilytica]